MSHRHDGNDDALDARNERREYREGNLNNRRVTLRN
jgi:hypothetical protein